MYTILCNDPMVILSQVLEEMKKEQGETFSFETVNLAELERRTGLSRSKLRRLKKNGFEETPHGLIGRKSDNTVLTGYTILIDNLLKTNVSNSSVIFERLKENGYKGGLTQIKVYIGNHKDLIPPKRQVTAPQGNRGLRYSTDPGEVYQMDWGFVNVEAPDGTKYKVACFVMICHHCGMFYVEFFTNAKQENLFIGMIHAFSLMGIPEKVMTDNMKSIVISRNHEGHPVWNNEYAVFMKAIGFRTQLCKPGHPFTKGKVERCIQFIKNNFLAGRTFFNLSDLNEDVREWYENRNSKYQKNIDGVPSEIHFSKCFPEASELEPTAEIIGYLSPVRCISFDGFVCYEGRRFGVPCRYTEHTCRVKRYNNTIYIMTNDFKVITTHDVTWSIKDSYCPDQYIQQPEETPTMPVKAALKQLQAPDHRSAFDKFRFDREEDLYNG